MVLFQRRPAATTVVDDVKARLLDAVVRERAGASFAGRADAAAHPARRADGREEKAFDGFAAYPVNTNNRAERDPGRGGRRVARMTTGHEGFLGQVANQAYIVMENSRLFERVKNLSIRDSLTDLYNHRHVMELVSVEFSRVGRYQEAFSLLMIDVDNFKKVNDAVRPSRGGRGAQGAARIIKETVRTVDVVGRYGGEEFVAVLPHTAHELAVETAERVRRRIQEHVFLAGERKVHVTSAWAWPATRRPTWTRRPR
jgi:diguanylate cyclase (GGDEF)-like protein